MDSRHAPATYSQLLKESMTRDERIISKQHWRTLLLKIGLMSENDILKYTPEELCERATTLLTPHELRIFEAKLARDDNSLMFESPWRRHGDFDE